MTIPIDYPLGILPAPLVGKSRSQIENFDLRDNFDGRQISRQVRNTSPVFFDVQFRVQKYQALQFQIWLENVSNFEPFTIPLKTEGGTIDHVCQIQNPRSTPQESRGDVYTYSFTLYAEQLNNGLNTATDDEKDLIFNLGNDASLLAETVNEEWPT